MAKNDKPHALDILGDILQDTEREAAEEKRKREEAERLKREEARRKRDEDEARRRQEAEARIAAEEERKRLAEQRRIEVQKAMSGELEREAEEREAAAAAAAKKEVKEEEKSSAPALLIAAAVLIAVGVGGYFGYQEMTTEYVSPASFARASPQVVDVASTDSSQEIAFVAKPVIEEPEEEAEPERRAAPRRNTNRQPERQGLQLRRGLSGR